MTNKKKGIPVDEQQVAKRMAEKVLLPLDDKVNRNAKDIQVRLMPDLLRAARQLC